MNKKKDYIFLFFLIFAINIFLYFPCLNAYFVNDDYNWIKPVQFSEVVSSFWGGWGHGALYRPLTRLLFYIEYLLFNNSPIGYHIISIFLQSSAIFLFFLIIKSLFRDKNLIIFLPLTVIFFYPYHEVVCWISAQTALLSINFIFLSIISFLRFIENKTGLSSFISPLVFFILALLSYEIAIVVPLLLIVVLFFNDVSILNRKKVLFQNIAPYFLILLFFLFYRNLILSGLPDANEFTINFHDWISNFLKLIKFQFLQNIFLTILFVLSSVYFVFVKKKVLYLLFSVIWFLLCYIPFLFVNGYTGRFAYLSMFGILFLIGAAACNIYFQFKNYRILVISVFTIYIALNGFKIHQNSTYWYEAGEIARTIPLELKDMYDSFPDNSTLIFYDIPLGYKQSGVFLTYFEDVIQGEYTNKLNIIHVAHPFNKNFNYSAYSDKPNVYKFKYLLSDRKLVELK